MTGLSILGKIKNEKNTESIEIEHTMVIKKKSELTSERFQSLLIKAPL